MSEPPVPRPRAEELAEWVTDSRERTLVLVRDLSDEQLRVPLTPILNPLLWEIGHVAWFQEKWVLRNHDGEPTLMSGADVLYDSAAVPHDARWQLQLPGREQTVTYLLAVRDRVLSRLRGNPTPAETYFNLLAVYHEDMHGEAFTYSRQTLAYPPPELGNTSGPAAAPGSQSLAGDVRVPGGRFLLGTPRGEGFAFDNEHGQHVVEIRPFLMARTPVTQAQFAEFVDDGGYSRRELWSEEGWAWREGALAGQPLYYRRGENGGWLRRHFDRWLPLEPHRPVIHVNWYEASAYCHWAGRRLPTEGEWEAAAAGEASADGRSLALRKRRFPWGDEPPAPSRANLDSRAMGTLDVGCLPAGDSAFGCRQMIGNVWEWTASSFLPYPGFEPGPYAEYSAPWFGTHKVLRGGAWTTRSRLIHNHWRNFYTADRRDVLAGFRTCRENS